MTDYSAFVAARFTKRHTGPEGLLHAAVGIVGELIAANVAKLRKSYPDGYTDALAIARMDKA